MNWKEFEGRPNRRHADHLRVTLSHRGVLVLNKIAYAALDMPAAVTLHYDENERVIGLKPADARRPNAFPLKSKGRGGSHRLISASPFCRHFHIRVERTVLFNDVDLDGHGVIMLPLASATRIGKRW